jgi:Zn-dependent oligopeptidase
MTDNPLLIESPRPYHLPPFDRIKNEDFAPAYEQGMVAELKEVEAIAGTPEPPTFDNTIVALKRAGQLLKRVDRVFSNLNSTYFSHIFSDDEYSAGYYSYIWAEVLDADSMEWFRQHDGLTRANGDRFRQTVLSRGGSEEALTLFRNFTGGDPYIEPLLKRRGLD